jgi:DNA-3-methyladenine glycosylase
MNHLNEFESLNIPAYQAAPRLLGSILQTHINDEVVEVKIVETEAYDQSDPASHSYKNKTKRTEIMFGPPGFLYVYFTYGMHYCCNVVVGSNNYGCAVLIRAVEPIKGMETLKDLYPGKKENQLLNGPAKLCKVLNIDKKLNGHFLGDEPLKLILKPQLSKERIIATTRIGISKAQDIPWRFYIKDNPFISVK